MALIRLLPNLVSPMSFFVDVSSAEIDLTTVASGILRLIARDGSTTKDWGLVPVAGATAGFVSRRHDFVAGDTDTLDTFALSLSLTTDPAGTIPIRIADLIEIAN